MGISSGENQESIMASIPYLHISPPSDEPTQHPLHPSQHPLHPSSMPEDRLADQVLEETMVLASKKLRKRFPDLFPMQALFKQVMAAKLDFPTNRSLLEQLIQAAGTPPPDAEIDKATREAIAVSAKSLSSDSSPQDLIRALVPAVEQASSFHGLAMKWAVAARLLRWSELPPALPAVKAVYVEEFVAALQRLGQSLLSTEAAEAALVAAIDRMEGGGDDDDSPASATTSKRALKQHLVAARKRLKGGSLMDEAFKKAIMATLAYAGVYDPQARKLENMLVAVFAAASDSSKAVAMALGKLVHRSKPPPSELFSKVLTSMKQLELCTGVDHQDQYSASINPTDVEKSASFVLTTDTPPSNTDDNSKESMVADMVLKEALSIAARKLEMSTRSLFPMDALVKSTQKLDLHHRTKWAILERIVNTGRTSPEETVVDKALAVAVAGVIEEACVTGEWEGLDVVGALVDAIIESLEEPPVKYALTERLILACKPAQDEFSGNKVLRDGFKVAVDKLQLLKADQTSPLQALTGAIRRLPVDSSLQMNLVEALCGAYDDAKAAGQEEGKGEEGGKEKVEEEEVDAVWLLDQSTIDRLIAAKQKFKISSFGTAAANKFAQQRPTQKK